MGQPGELTKKQSDALNTYNDAVKNFKSILGQRRAQINSKQSLPNLPGQALYLARINMMSTYKDLTDALPSKIGKPNKFGIPPAYFDADNEPLIDEYRSLFDILEAPPVQRAKIRYAIQDVEKTSVFIDQRLIVGVKVRRRNSELVGFSDFGRKRVVRSLYVLIMLMRAR